MNMHDPVCDFLREARGYLKGEETWTRGVRNDLHGRRCALGLLDAAKYHGQDDWSLNNYKLDHTDKLYGTALTALAAGVPGGHAGINETCDAFIIAEFNNRSNYEAVCDWFDRTIEVRQLMAVKQSTVSETPELAAV